MLSMRTVSWIARGDTGVCEGCGGECLMSFVEKRCMYYALCKCRCLQCYLLHHSS